MDLVRTLPQDWRARVLEFESEPSLRPLVQRLQETVRLLGDAAILVDLVQDLATLACLPRQRTRLDFYGLLFDRLRVAAQGEWPVIAPFQEKRPESKSALALLGDVDSSEAEWLVLDRLITLGWVPREALRLGGEPDWLVEGPSRLRVEVKFKKHPSHVPMFWASMMKGIGMLPAGAFLSRFKWRLEITRTARDPSIFPMAQTILENLPAVERLLAVGLDPRAQPAVVAIRDRFTLTARCGFNDGRQAFEGIDFHLKGNDLVLKLAARESPLAPFGVWEPGEMFTTWERPYDETVAADLTAIFTRLNIGSQLKRNGDVLVVVRWQVAPELMGGVNATWLRSFWNDLTAREGWPRAVLWPVGVPRIGDYRWIENDGAKEVLVRNVSKRPPLLFSSVSLPPGRFGVRFISDLWDAARVDDVAIELRELTRQRGAMIDHLRWTSAHIPERPDAMLVTLTGDRSISRDLVSEAARKSGVELEAIEVMQPND